MPHPIPLFLPFMSLFITSLNSGSNGNCYYIGNDTEAVLVDAGISCRETEKRMKRLGLDMSKIKAVFISHEHGDHISGVETLANKYRLPVYITAATLANSRLRINTQLVRGFAAYEPVSIGDLSVLAFPKLHDAIDPHSFVISHKGVNVGVFTDIGSPCKHVIENFGKCHIAFLEANYDEYMLENGRYPIHLKRRISGDKGHLSNNQALELFIKHKHPELSLLYLSHLSKDNNSPHLALDLFASFAEDTDIAVASRYKETPVSRVPTGIAATNTDISPAETVQMSLF